MSKTTKINIDWDIILETIKTEKCILLTGPELFTFPNGNDVRDELANYLGVPDNPIIHSYYEEDELFLFTSRVNKTKAYYKIKSFYENGFPHAEKLLEKIAKIPFHLIINVTLDTALQDTFERLNLKHKFDFYWKNHTTDRTLTPPKKTNPLIFNLLGSIDQQESLVLSHDDLFEYFSSILGTRGLPQEIKQLIQEADNFIFLGMPFDKWYIQIILRVFYLHLDKYDFMRFAASQETDEEIKSFVTDQFKIEFVSDKIPQFVDDLYDKCEAAGLLRKSGESQSQNIIKQLTQLLASGQIEEVLKRFNDYLSQIGEQGKKVLDDVILLMNRFQRVSRKMNQGVIDHQESELELNKISKSILELLGKTQELM